MRAVYYGQCGQCMVHTPAGAASAWFIRIMPVCIISLHPLKRMQQVSITIGSFQSHPHISGEDSNDIR